jgi:hypothetical protein
VRAGLGCDRLSRDVRRKGPSRARLREERPGGTALRLVPACICETSERPRRGSAEGVEVTASARERHGRARETRRGSDDRTGDSFVRPAPDSAGRDGESENLRVPGRGTGDNGAGIGAGSAREGRRATKPQRARRCDADAGSRTRSRRFRRERRSGQLRRRLYTVA